MDSGELDWKFGQVFGDKTPVEDVNEGLLLFLFFFLLISLSRFLVFFLFSSLSRSLVSFCFLSFFSLFQLFFSSPSLSPFSLSFSFFNLVDIVSAVEFDQSGDFLAAGDRWMKAPH